jgi:hypothetical protein
MVVGGTVVLSAVVLSTVVLSTVVLKHDGARKYWCSRRESNPEPWD